MNKGNKENCCKIADSILENPFNIWKQIQKYTFLKEYQAFFLQFYNNFLYFLYL